MGQMVNATLPPGKTRCPLYRRLDGSQGRSGQVRENSPTPKFDLRTDEPVACRYTDRAFPAHSRGMGMYANHR